MNSKIRIPALAAMAVALAFILAPIPGGAIPAWGRKYDMECSMCHMGGFKLTPSGREFLRNGHQFLEKKDASKKDKDPNLSDYASLAMKFRGYVKRTTHSVTNSATDAGYNKDSSSFEQHNLSLYAGGPLDHGFSFFAEMYLSENSGKTSGTSDFDDYGRSKLAETVLQYTYGTSDINLNIRGGQLISSLLHLNGVGARLTQDRPAVLGMKIGSNPYSPFTRQFGLAVAQKVYGATAEVGLVNGTGSSTYNRIDNDNNKDAWATLDYAIDGEKFSTLVGVYGYKGTYPVGVDNPAVYAGDDDFGQVAGMASFTIEDVGHFTGSVYRGENYAKLAGTKSADVVSSLGGYGELAAYFMDGKLIPYVRYDFVDTNQNVELNEQQGYQVGLQLIPYDHGHVTVHAGQTEKPAKLQSSYSIDSNLTTEFVFIF